MRQLYPSSGVALDWPRTTTFFTSIMQSKHKCGCRTVPQKDQVVGSFTGLEVSGLSYKICKMIYLPMLKHLNRS